MDNAAVIDITRRWIASMVIGLNLCPFARRVFEGDTIRYVVSNAVDSDTLLGELAGELRALGSGRDKGVETTLLIHPRALNDFLTFNDFLDDAERLVRDLGLEGVVQVASFHPDYQFAETDPAAAENYTSRSPYPMLHLLHEDSITAVASDPQYLLDIPQRNIETLRGLGLAEIQEMLKAVMAERPAEEN